VWGFLRWAILRASYRKRKIISKKRKEKKRKRGYVGLLKGPHISFLYVILCSKEIKCRQHNYGVLYLQLNT
jgi:hypothetical protein